MNTGAFDSFDDIADATAEKGAWLHVDGAFGLWAAASPKLRHLVLGVERAASCHGTCDCARRFAEGVAELEGVEMLNDVVLNQVLFRFESDDRTDGVLRAVQEAGDVWMSGTIWDGRRAIRLSVSNWQTEDEEVDLELDAFRTAASQLPAHVPAR